MTKREVLQNQYRLVERGLRNREEFAQLESERLPQEEHERGNADLSERRWFRRRRAKEGPTARHSLFSFAEVAEEVDVDIEVLETAIVRIFVVPELGAGDCRWA